MLSNRLQVHMSIFYTIVSYKGGENKFETN